MMSGKQWMLAFLFATATAQAGLPAQCPTSKELSTQYVFVSQDAQIKADRILVYKKSRELMLLWQNRVLSHHKISLGLNPMGHKRQQGDMKTPEGRYFISLKNPNSAYHLSLKVSYPNAQDRKWARDNGVNPGGDIFVHGWPNDPKEREDVRKKHGRVDWTYGCVAVTDEEVREIYQRVDINTVIDLCP